MPFPLAIAFEEAEALFPLGGQDIPDKPKRVEPLTTVWRHSIFGGALHANPLS